MAREPSPHLLLGWVVAPLNMIPAAMATTTITPRITSASFTTIGQQSDPFLATSRTVSFLHMDHFPRIGSNLSRRSTKGRALGGAEKHENGKPLGNVVERMMHPSRDKDDWMIVPGPTSNVFISPSEPILMLRRSAELTHLYAADLTHPK